MTEAEQLSHLIADIYDAALDAALWPHALGKARGYVRGRAASLVWKDAAAKSSSGHYMDDGGGMHPRHVQLYFEKYIRLDPFTTAQFLAEIGSPLSAVDMMPLGEFLETRFYKEWLWPQRLVDGICTVLDKSVTSFAMLVVFRHERDGLADDEACSRARLIAPHLRRAVLIGRTIAAKTAEAATLADTLDGLSTSMILVDAYGRIVHANAAGHAMLAEGSVLCAAGRKLAANDMSAERALHDVFLAAGSGDPAVGVKGIAVPLTARDGERWVAHVLPLTSGKRRRAGTT